MIIHPRAKISDNFKLPSIRRAKHFKHLLLPLQVFFLVMRRNPGVCDCFLFLEIFQLLQSSLKIHFSGMFWFKRSLFQINYYKRSQFQMIKKKIQIKILFANIQMKLPSDKSKALPQFKKKLLNMTKKSKFKFSLTIRLCNR